MKRIIHRASGSVNKRRGTALPDADAALAYDLERRLGYVEDALQHIAEVGRGAASRSQLEQLSQQVDDLRRQGLPALADGIAGIVRESNNLAGSLLRAYYLCMLHREAAIKSKIQI